MSDAVTLKIMPIEQCGAVRNCMASPSSYKSHMPCASYSEPSQKRVAEFALQQLEAAWKADVDAHGRNEAAIANNKALQERIMAFMDEIGMPRTRKVQCGTRYGMPKYKTVDAGYIEDMRANIKVYDNFELAEQTYNRLKTAYDKYLAEAVAEEEKAQAAVKRAEEVEKQRRLDNIQFAKIILRYNLPEDSTPGEVLEALRKKDQRLDLAVAMQQTRSDWRDGFWRVSDALDRFKIHDDEDKEIAACVIEAMRDCDDGRVFRDCAWSYTRLFNSAADEQLAADIQFVMSKVQVE